jgi:hypothetical protein
VIIRRIFGVKDHNALVSVVVSIPLLLRPS